MATQPATSHKAAMVKEEENLSTISLSRIPEFWRELPRLWFTQFEATVNPQNQSDSTRFQLVIAKLGRDALQQVSDIVYKPPDTNKYKAIKDRLIQIFEESPERQFQRLVGEMELGSQKPSQLLRRMRELASNCQASDETVSNLWLSRLPTAVRAVLAASQDQKLDSLAPIADKVMESTQHSTWGPEVASTDVPRDPMTEVLAQMNKLAVEVATLRSEVSRRRTDADPRGRPRWRDRNQQSRWRSRRRTPRSSDWLCQHHFRYGSRASNCEQPCSWRKSQGLRAANSEETGESIAVLENHRVSVLDCKSGIGIVN